MATWTFTVKNNKTGEIVERASNNNYGVVFPSDETTKLGNSLLDRYPEPDYIIEYSVWKD